MSGPQHRKNEYLKQRILKHYKNLSGKVKNYGIFGKIVKLLEDEKLYTHRGFVRRTINTFNSCGKLYRDNKNGRTSKLFKNCTIRSIIDDRLKKNDEETAKSLQVYLQYRNFQLSISTINRIKQSLGWTLRGTRYCQLIREANKPKRVQWANDHISDTFENVIWSDETSVWLEQHATRCYRRRGVLPKRKPKPKYPLKVHVWAGISKKGKTEVCIFKGIMDAKLYVKIIEETLLPFIRNKYPRRHRFMQDNDPKHKSLLARRFFEENNINWWKTPAGE
ncbi:hypothetical protein FSP39_008937 [Pinctada imbricata]|uniref:Transposase Tc1-like domain-containing protein n=1 Tax=Pinctada imbricata TaxID=66713 RepID=A0AA88YPC7_PINIB|nr:hypothetical protein FSP39_008937 [Pinctada imbricata]